MEKLAKAVIGFIVLCFVIFVILMILLYR